MIAVLTVHSSEPEGGSSGGCIDRTPPVVGITPNPRHKEASPREGGRPSCPLLRQTKWSRNRRSAESTAQNNTRRGPVLMKQAISLRDPRPCARGSFPLGCPRRWTPEARENLRNDLAASKKHQETFCQPQRAGTVRERSRSCQHSGGTEFPCFPPQPCYTHRLGRWWAVGVRLDPRGSVTFSLSSC